MRRISAIFVPRLLSDDQKAVRVCICRKLKQQARVDPSFIPNIITGFKLWVFGYEPETKQQGSQWMSSNSTRPKKERQVRRNVKSVLIVFTISKALSTSNSYPLVKLSMANFTVWMWSGWGRAFGLNVQTSGRKQLIYPTRQRARLHIIRCSKIPDVQKHYSGSLPPIRLTSPPATFSYSPKMKLRLKGRRFDTTEEIHAETQEVIDTLIIENFQGCMKSWETCWDRCRLAQGDYFEGDGGN